MIRTLRDRLLFAAPDGGLRGNLWIGLATARWIEGPGRGRIDVAVVEAVQLVGLAP